MPKIYFNGAAKTVTGSSYLFETPKTKVLIDCGLFQGLEVETRNLEPFNFNPKEIDFVILTHAHMDHSGMLPRLVREGFNGRIFLTPPTAALAEVLLLDAAKIQEQNAKKTKEYTEAMPYKLHLSLYDTFDALKTISMFSSLDFNTNQDLGDGLSFKFIKAGHILGAASVVLSENGKEYVFSGDIGRSDQSIVETFDLTELGLINPELVIMESLYGGVEHPDHTEAINQLLGIINETHKNNGNVIIPSFAVHRTQELLEILKITIQNSLISKDVQIFLDSPLAIQATNIYTSSAGYFNDSFSFNDINVNYAGKVGDLATSMTVSQKSRFDIDNIKFIRKGKRSLKLKSINKSIIIAGSGMADGGRILNHLYNELPNSKSSVVFVGFQAEGTLGRQIVDGADQVTINKRQIKVNANIHYLRGFSAHGDNTDLLNWLKAFNRSNLKNIFLTHAEEERSVAFSEELKALGYEPIIPEWKADFSY